MKTDLPVQESFLVKEKKVNKWKLLCITIITLSFVNWTNNMYKKTFKSTKNKRNVILMISDGFGPASETFARNYVSQVGNLPYNTQLALDTILVGSSRTRSSSSLVTDSAAGATAFSCVMKTYNGAIGVDPEQQPCGTILEAAFEAGYKTGLVVTSRITHATPASFASHVIDRDMENLIAEHLIGNYSLGRTLDLMMGGGICHFNPAQISPSCRKDDRNLFEEAKKENWDIGTTIKEFHDISAETAKLPLMRLFTPDHMSYNIDRDPAVEPSLKEMAQKALQVLAFATRNSEKGFFLMIEGSRIDMAAHSNDPGAHLHEIFAYHETVDFVKKFVDSHSDTVMISVSDHETGGLSLARQLSTTYPEYRWFPQALANVTASTVSLANKLAQFNDQEKQRDFIITEILGNGLGIADATQDQIDLLSSTKVVASLDYYLSDILSRRAEIGWATHGHSSVDVNLYAYGAESFKLAGNHENTEIGGFIKQFLDLNVDNVTRKFKDNRTKTSPLVSMKTKKKGFRRVHYHNPVKQQE